MTEKTANPIHIAIVGSGPSGFFCADDLLRLAQPCQVHLFDRRPYPFGLVRDGVAPDHENIRSVMRAFDRTAQHKDFFFHGNVEIGDNPSVSDILAAFDAVIVATGAELPKELVIPGADRPGCIAAAHFAEWYNGSPAFASLNPCLDIDTVVVIGGGNVALDVVRMLAQPYERLRHTDISSTALAALQQSRVRDIHVVVRGAMSTTRFSPVELEFLAAVPGCSYTISERAEPPPTRVAPAHTPAIQERNAAILRQLAVLHPEQNSSRKRIHFHFGKRPMKILGDVRVEGMLLESSLDHGRGTEEDAGPIACQMVVYAIGQQGTALPGLPFDLQKGLIPHHAGRIAGVPRAYVAGWIKRGASGVIGLNKPDCRETVKSIIKDRNLWQGIQGCAPEAGMAAWLSQLQGCPISYADWKRLDTEEQRRGSALGKSRERFRSCDEMVAYLSKREGQCHP